MSCAHAHWVGSKPIHRVMQLKLHKPTIAIGHSLRTCTHVDSTNPGRSVGVCVCVLYSFYYINKTFYLGQNRSRKMSNRLIDKMSALNILPLMLAYCSWNRLIRSS